MLDAPKSSAGVAAFLVRTDCRSDHDLRSLHESWSILDASSAPRRRARRHLRSARDALGSAATGLARRPGIVERPAGRDPTSPSVTSI
jgi:hypothetical protein